MSDELNTAKLKIAELEEKLDNVTTTRKESAIEQQLAAALARLEVLERKKPENKDEGKPKSELEDEEGTQCPECGGELFDLGDGVFKCSECKELWEDE